VRRILIGLASVLALLVTAWASLALWFDGPAPRLAAGALAASFAVAMLSALFLLRRRWLGVSLWLAGLALVSTWEWSLEPRNDRNWQPYLERTPRMQVRDGILHVRNLRNFDHHSATEFTPHWETRTYDLSELRGVDLFLSYWGPRWIAHTIASWDFGDGGHLAISIETRMEEDEEYSAVRGFFRQYEIYYVVGDERDLVRWRTNPRQEDVYLYRLAIPPQLARRILLAYAEEIESVALEPEWYNALSDNCTTSIRHRVVRAGGADPWDWRLLLNGKLDELLYERASVDTRLPFAELRERSWISGRARTLAETASFSEEIRSGLPDPREQTLQAVGMEAR